jgi:hypothetical protein
MMLDARAREKGQLRICPDPVFLLGAERSGTTILAVSLGRHSQLWFSGESHVFPILFEPQRVDRAYETGTHRWRLLREEGVARQEFVEALGMGVNALFTSRSHGRRWIEKTPRNTHMADLLADMFPEGYFVHILRDGREVVNSMIHFLDDPDPETRNSRLHGGAGPAWARDFTAACRTWRTAVDAALDFSDAAPERCLTVGHDDLVRDAGRTFAVIFDFLQVPFESDPVDHFRTTRLNTSFGEESRPTGRDAWMSWSEEWREVFRCEAGRAMERCRFVWQKEGHGAAR